MGKKIFTFVLAFGILFSIDCKELMRYGKICPIQKLTENKKLPPCHGAKDSTEKKDCNCKIGEKGTFEKSELKIKAPTVATVLFFELSDLYQNKPINKNFSSIVTNRIPIYQHFALSTIHLLI